MRTVSSKRLFFLIFAVLSVIFLFHYRITGQAVYGDGKFYWSYVRSVWKDHDLDLTNELNRIYTPKANNDAKEIKASNQKVFNWFPIGVSIAWSPAFILADGIANVFHRFMPSFPNNGYSNLYQIMVGLENVGFVALGLSFLYKLLQKYFSRTISLLTTGSLLLGTNLFFYGGIDVINSHSFSFLLGVLYLYLWLATRKKRSLWQWMGLGILLSWMVMVRTQEAIFILPLLFDFIFQKETLTEKLIKSGVSAIFFVIFFVPQMLAWKYYFGNYFLSPYLMGGFDFLHPHIIDVLFDKHVGLLVWTPLYFVCLVGFCFIRSKDRRMLLPVLIMFVAQFYLITSWSGWNQGRAFSIRMLITGLPYLSFGLGLLLTKLHESWSKKSIYVLIIFFAIYNSLSIMVFLTSVQR